MQTINIAQVLSEIRSSTDQTTPFVLTYVKSLGSNRGQIRTIAKCVKGTPTRTHTKKGDTKGPLHKEHDTLPLIDLELNKYRTIPISHIIGYNQYQVIH